MKWKKKKENNNKEQREEFLKGEEDMETWSFVGLSLIRSKPMHGHAEAFVDVDATHAVVVVRWPFQFVS